MKKPKSNPAPEPAPVEPSSSALTVVPAESLEKRPAHRKTKLTPEVQQKIVDAILEGAYDWVAARAVGINQDTFYYWLQRGEAGESPYSEFSEAVGHARAEARRGAEAAVRKSDPLSWLMKGPGRERPGEPGWASPSDTRQMEAVQGSGPTWAQWAALQAQLLAILLKYPDVHQAAAQAFQQVASARKRNGDADSTP
jgi:transposase-like protein